MTTIEKLQGSFHVAESITSVPARTAPPRLLRLLRRRSLPPQLTSYVQQAGLKVHIGPRDAEGLPSPQTVVRVTA